MDENTSEINSFICFTLLGHSGLTYDLGWFNHEILCAYGRVGFLDSRRCGWDWEEEAYPFITRYLCHRPWNSNAATMTFFPALINAIVDKVIEVEDGLELRQNQKYLAEAVMRGRSETPGDREIGIDRRYTYLHTLIRHCIRDSLFWRSHFLDCYRYPHGSLRPIPSSITHFPLSSHILSAAIILQKLPLVSHLLKTTNLSSPTCNSEFWGAPLHAAAYIGSIPLVSLLLAHGSDPNEPSMSKTCDAGYVQGFLKSQNAEAMVGLLLGSDLLLPSPVEQTTSEKKFDSSRRKYLRKEERSSLFNEAMRLQNIRLAALLLEPEREASELKGQTQEEYLINLFSCLQRACLFGDIPVVQRMLELGSPLNVPVETWNGATVAVRRIQEGEKETYVIERLVEKEAIIQANSDRESCMVLLALQRFKEKGKAGEERRMEIEHWEMQMLDLALRKGLVGLAHLLIQKGGLRFQAVQYLNYLRHAVQVPEAVPAIEYILQSGRLADPSFIVPTSPKQKNLAEIMIAAAERGNVEVVKMLWKHGVSVDDEDWYAAQQLPLPIVVATKRRKVEVMGFLRGRMKTEWKGDWREWKYDRKAEGWRKRQLEKRGNGKR